MIEFFTKIEEEKKLTSESTGHPYLKKGLERAIIVRNHRVGCTT